MLGPRLREAGLLSQEETWASGVYKVPGDPNAQPGGGGARSEARRPVSDYRLELRLSAAEAWRARPTAHALPFTCTTLTACTRPTLFSAQQT